MVAHTVTRLLRGGMRITATAALGGLLLLASPPSSVAQHRLTDFSGAVYGMDASLGDGASLGVGWDRDLQVGGFGWDELQPNRSSPFLWGPTDAAVAEAQQRGSHILPILAYTPAWAQTQPAGCSYAAANRTDWEHYVSAVVERYTAKGVQHYQIWNEPGWPNKPFYCGTEASFVLDVYLPAARIIRRAGGRVVFGGWMSIYSMDAFQELLLLGDGTTTVLEMTDVLDVHYHGVSELVEMYEWANGTKGMWMSELGFLDFENYLPNVYLRYLQYIASEGRWNRADDFVLIWYASWGAGGDAPKCLSFTNASSGQQQLTTHGQHLKLMSTVFRNATIQAFDRFTATTAGAGAGAPQRLSPQLDEERSAAMGFALGDAHGGGIGSSEKEGGLVFALLLGNDTWTGAEMTLTLKIDLALGSNSNGHNHSDGTSKATTAGAATGGEAQAANDSEADTAAGVVRVSSLPSSCKMVVAPSGLTVPLTPTITSPENHHDHDTHGGSASSRGARMELT